MKSRDLPPFVYLSGVLQQYGRVSQSLQTATDGPEGEIVEPVTAFGRFLAERVKSGMVLLFDVHSLKLVVDEELDDVVEYLLNYTTDSKHPLNVGIAAGLDYCVDAHNLSEEIRGDNSWPSLEYQSPIDDAKRPSPTQPKTPMVSVYSSDDPSAWEEEPKVPLTAEFIELQLAFGRNQAARERVLPARVFPKTKKSSPITPRDRSDYRGATMPKDWSFTFGDDRIYLAGKFNISGDPALLLEDIWRSPEKVGRRGHLAGSKLALRAEKWQLRLNAMYSSGPDKGKPHRTLCGLLAKKLNEELPASQIHDEKFKTKPEMIRRETDDPGNRKPGGRRPST